MALKFCGLLLQRTSAAHPSVASLKAIKIMDRIATEVADGRKRLFAVVYLNGRQFKVSENDLIALRGNLPLDVGDKIKLEKLLLVGGNNFTFIGRPILRKPSVTVNATVVEKCTTYPKLQYKHINHAQITETNWLSTEMTVLRINEILLDETQLKSMCS